MNAIIDISNVSLETTRLLLRPFKDEDLDDFFEYAKVDGVGQMAGWLPHKDKDETKNILSMFINEKKTFAIVYKENNKVIGSIGIEEMHIKEFAESSLLGRELGFVLAKDYWGNGLMPEACNKVMEYLFRVVKLDFITCGYFAWNKQSGRVQEKLGFKPIGKCIYKTRYGTEEETIINIIYK